MSKIQRTLKTDFYNSFGDKTCTWPESLDNPTWSELIWSHLQSDFSSFNINTHALHCRAFNTLDYGELARIPLWLSYICTKLPFSNLKISEFQSPKGFRKLHMPVSTLYQFLQVFIPNLQFFSYIEICFGESAHLRT